MSDKLGDDNRDSLGELNPNSGPTQPWRPRAQVVHLVPNTWGRIYTYTCPRVERKLPPLPPDTPVVKAWDPAEDARYAAERRKQENNLGIGFLGPIFGGLAAAARVFGAPEPVVENAGQIGLNAAGAVGVPGAARGVGRVIEPVPTEPVPIRIEPIPRGIGTKSQSVAIKGAPQSAPLGQGSGAFVGPRIKYGPFYRLVGREEIELVEKSGQVMGKAPRNFYQSDIPKVKAHAGELPPGRSGYEFYTYTPPDKSSVPGGPLWSGSKGEEWHSIDVTVTKVNK